MELGVYVREKERERERERERESEREASGRSGDRPAQRVGHWLRSAEKAALQLL